MALLIISSTLYFKLRTIRFLTVQLNPYSNDFGLIFFTLKLLNYWLPAFVLTCWNFEVFLSRNQSTLKVSTLKLSTLKEVLIDEGTFALRNSETLWLIIETGLTGKQLNPKPVDLFQWVEHSNKFTNL
jgi:hypothetical protein